MKWLAWIFGILFGVALLYFIIPGFFALFVSRKKIYTKDSKLYRNLLNAATAIGLCVMRVKICVSGSEKLPQGQKLLFVGNHRSNFDPIITWYVFRNWRISYLSKAGNFKIPIFGRLIHRCCFLTIDRKSPRKAVEAVNQAALLLTEQEVSIGVYPEGTRSKSGELLPFHSGVLRIAQKGNAAVAVVAISGTEKIHKNYPFRSSRIEVSVLDVFSTEEVQSMRTAELSDRIREKLENSLSEKNSR